MALSLVRRGSGGPAAPPRTCPPHREEPLERESKGGANVGTDTKEATGAQGLYLSSLEADDVVPSVFAPVLEGAIVLGKGGPEAATR